VVFDRLSQFAIETGQRAQFVERGCPDGFEAAEMTDQEAFAGRADPRDRVQR
jgi:hypothetical protein